MAREVLKKATLRINRTRVVSYIDEHDPVYRGVLIAAEILGGFPEHVGRITIRVEEVPLGRRYVINGRCWCANQGPSSIVIYAGSIKVSATDPDNVSKEAINTTLHEIGHSRRGREVQEGFWMGQKPSRQDLEVDAEAYVGEAYVDYLLRKERHHGF